MIRSASGERVTGKVLGKDAEDRESWKDGAGKLTLIGTLVKDGDYQCRFEIQKAPTVGIVWLAPGPGLQGLFAEGGDPTDPDRDPFQGQDVRMWGQGDGRVDERATGDVHGGDERREGEQQARIQEEWAEIERAPPRPAGFRSSARPHPRSAKRPGGASRNRPADDVRASPVAQPAGA